jgi:hypothetical protein
MIHSIATPENWIEESVSCGTVIYVNHTKIQYRLVLEEFQKTSPPVVTDVVICLDIAQAPHLETEPCKVANEKLYTMLPELQGLRAPFFIY